MMTRRASTIPDYRTVTEREHKAWSSGDFARTGSLAVLHGELLCEALDIRPGETVLDVAAGAGAASLAAARRWADVTATDIADSLLDPARRVADIYGLSLITRLADAANLPFEDDSFDVVMSTFGAMFYPDPQRVADEMTRTCRPGGRIGMCNWAPESLMAEIFRVTSRHVAALPGPRSAAEWGSQERLGEVFGNRIRSLQLETRQLVLRYRSPEHMLQWLRSWYAPTRTAFATLDRYGRARLAAELLEMVCASNWADDGTLVAASDYVEVVAVVR
jgi:ubiquinone/menaquinone biosynthesis C-methylase UbiE